MAKESIVTIEGKQLRLSNLDKVMYPAVGFTKAQVIDYYVRIAPALLPHVRDRALTLKRYPNGVEGMHFYEKSCPKHRPDFVETMPVWSPGRKATIDYCMLQDVPTLVWAANLADLELHTSLSRSIDILRPTILAFDLDPGAPADIVQCCKVGLELKKLFAGMGMECFPKTSGSKGLQVYVPLNTPVTYDETKPFAHALAKWLEEQHPQEIVSDMKKTLRTGKVFVDWSQNDDYKTTVSVYSLRAKERPTVSTPVTWAEVAHCLKAKDGSTLVFDSEQVLERVDKMGDLFAPVNKLKQKLNPGKAPERLAQLYEIYAPIKPAVKKTPRRKKA
ncbi:MAG TPA: non-homologous end-joining DNA ligase [Terriglobales bacterium]|nr:non-homologous end-joining DNA ligase [Terriglobales bacterium]